MVMARTGEDMMNNNNIGLPEDMVTDILMRLPVKSLARLKCVCKSWYAIINSPKFIRQHLSRTSSSHKNNDSILLFDYQRWGKPKISLLSNKNLQVFGDVSAPFFGDFSTDLYIYGPCDGLVCMCRPCVDNHANDKIALWNPATREFRVLPLPQVPSQPGEFISSNVDYGFGFDSKSNDYKVVRISTFYNLYDQVELYRLSTNSWRKVDTNFPASTTYPKLSSYVNGFYYWWAKDQYDYLILSFDMSNEVFEKMLPPPIVVYGHKAPLDCIVELNGSIAIVCNNNTTAGNCLLTIWVMNEDGVAKNKWTKHLEIELWFVIWHVLGICSNGDILMEGCSYEGGDLVSYDPRTQKKEHHGIRAKDNSLEVVIYRESLVSLSSKKDNNFKNRINYSHSCL